MVDWLILIAIIGIPALLLVLLCIFDRPICFGCGKPIYEKSYVGITAPTNASAHDRPSCMKLVYEKLESEPHKSIADEYIKELNRRRNREAP